MVDTRANANPTADHAPTLYDLGTPLEDVTFTVVDLETTGLAADACGITEIGAVKVRGGSVIAEFSTLVNPHEPIHPRITRLTGISDDMVANAPDIGDVLPSFLEFAAGTTWVAHNAGFDIGFLRHACQYTKLPWPRPPVIDTVALARKLTDKSEVPNRRLRTLARLFGSRTTPNHRALDDARATVTVLHGLLERAAGHGVLTDTELAEFNRAIPSKVQQSKRHLAEALPHRPGVYVFRDAEDRALYVGLAGNIATRVRSYFSAGENRSRMRDMIASTERIEAIPCAHRLEASIKELRMIHTGRPPYNRAQKNPERRRWIRLTEETYPRLTVARKPPESHQDLAIGPIASQAAHASIAALHTAFTLRQCRTKLSPTKTSPTCVLGQIGKCPEPCQLRVTPAQYAQLVEHVGQSLTGDPADAIAAITHRIEELAAEERFEEAANHRDHLGTLLRTVWSTQRLRQLVATGEMIAAAPVAKGGWDVALIRCGRLAAAVRTPPRHNPMPLIEQMRLDAADTERTDRIVDGAHASEAHLLLKWLEEPQVRLVYIEKPWHTPVDSAGRHAALADQMQVARPQIRH
ncbi:DEDD exonuclease domain-containing protein [Natronoglycomyces albus]|uniref:DEDD exonuclease domain-containing protein n=1 Tax=Natronoglycomyces albus TaxID=2811108 RepID=A0A895XWH7_9ACTN|nr:DEDD exonuclease domain-containing protein [Natronoglycomyces albus]QSB06580.1 DEDD exonuclease domain-containing protein [Natronoglycomyces albus]